MFKRRGYIRKRDKETLLQILNESKDDWVRQQHMVDKSIEPHENVLYELKKAESRYFFLLKEAKVLFGGQPS